MTTITHHKVPHKRTHMLSGGGRVLSICRDKAASEQTSDPTTCSKTREKISSFSTVTFPSLTNHYGKKESIPCAMPQQSELPYQG